MSPLDPTIPLSVRPFQGVNILAIQEAQRRQDENRRLAEQDAFEREKFTAARQALAEQKQAQQAIGEAYAGSVDTDEQGNRKLNRQKFMEHVMATSPQSWPAIQEQLDKVDEADLRRRKTRAEVAKLEREDEAANDEATARFGFAVDLAGNTPEAWSLLRQDAIDNKRVKPEQLAPFDAAIQQDPAKISNITAALKSRLMKPGEEAKQEEAARRQDEIERRNAANEAIAQQRAAAQEERAAASEKRLEGAAAEAARHNRTMEGLSAQRAAQERAGGGQRPITQTAEASLITRLGNELDAAEKPLRELDRQVALMDTGINAARRGDKAQGAQAVLVTFQKILDPTSVVRESEYMRSAAGLALLDRIRGAYEQLSKGGAGVPQEELEKFARLAHEAADAQRSSTSGVRERIGKVADRYQIPRELVQSGRAETPKAKEDEAKTPAASGGGGGAIRNYQDYLKSRGK